MRPTISKLITSVFILGAFSLYSCGSNGSTKSGKPDKPEVKTADKSENDAGIAYVCIDSIINNYDFCTDHSKVLQKRMNSIQASLNAKGKALQNAVDNFQQKMQSGAITSRDQAAKIQSSLARQQADLEKLQSKYSESFEKERQKYNDEMKDSIENFLKDYNKDHRYSIILSKVENNILYADKSMDITEDVVNGLNKRYKSGKKK